MHAAMWAVLAAAVWVCALATPQPLHLERDSFRRPRPESPIHLDTWQKRDQNSISPLTDTSFSSQLMLRSPRGSRQYDVPQIGKYHPYEHAPSGLFATTVITKSLQALTKSDRTNFWQPKIVLTRCYKRATNTV